MNDDPEIEFFLSEMFGQQNVKQSGAESLQKSTDALDRFFNGLETYPSVPQAGGHEEANSALDDLRNFAKAEKQRVPTMTSREIRKSVVTLLRKAADAMAAL
jgi:hypothetical protein